MVTVKPTISVVCVRAGEIAPIVDWASKQSIKSAQQNTSKTIIVISIPAKQVPFFTPAADPSDSHPQSGAPQSCAPREV